MRRFAAVTAALLAGCGGASAQAPKTAPEGAAAKAAVAASGYDVSPVPAPAAITVTARFGDPAATRRALVVLFGKSYPPLEALTPEKVAAYVCGEPIADVLDLARPIDVAGVKLHGRVEAVASAAVADVEAAKKDLAEDFKLGKPGADGAIALDPIAPGEHLLGACELRPAFGEPAYRVVCGASARALAIAGPYLARTAVRATSTSQLHVEVPVHGAESIPLPPLKVDASESEAIGEKLGRGLFVETAADLSRLDLDASITPEGATGALGLKLTSASSPLARMGLALVRAPKPLPDTFWRLPADADAALYSQGVAREDYGTMRRDVIAFLRQTISEGLDPPLAAKATSLVERVVFTGGPILVAHGFDAEAAREAVNGAAPVAEADRRAEADALAGWALVALDEPTERWTTSLRDLFELARAPAKPKNKGEEPGHKTLTLSPVPASAGLPQGAMHLEARDVAPKARARRADDPPPAYLESDHVLVVPDGTRTWIAIGHSDARLYAKLRVALGRDASAPTLRDRAGLESLRAASTGFGGFVTVSAFAASDAPSAPPWGSDRGNARRLLDHVHELAAHGTTPIPFVLGGARAGAGGDVSLQVEFPRDALMAMIGAFSR